MICIDCGGPSSPWLYISGFFFLMTRLCCRAQNLTNDSVSAMKEFKSVPVENSLHSSMQPVFDGNGFS